MRQERGGEGGEGRYLHECANGSGREVNLCDLVLLDEIPVSIGSGEGGYTLKQEGRGAV